MNPLPKIWTSQWYYLTIIPRARMGYWLRRLQAAYSFSCFRGHVVFERIYFFFCICDDRPWHFLRCRFSVLFRWTLAYHFLSCVHRIFLFSRGCERKKLVYASPRIALMHVYVTQANFTTKPRFEIKNKRSFTEMNSQGSRVEKNTHAQKVQMQKILFTNEACWWNLLVWRNHA